VRPKHYGRRLSRVLFWYCYVSYALWFLTRGHGPEHLVEPAKTTANQDLDVLRNALNLHDALERPLTGTSLTPLVGRYVQELPGDPWGHPYLVDTDVGFVVSHGADGRPGGCGRDRDHFVYYKPEPRVLCVTFEGAVGPPRRGARLVIVWSKPVRMVSPASVLECLQLFQPGEDGISLASLNRTYGHGWQVPSRSTTILEDHVLVLENECDARGSAFQILQSTSFGYATPANWFGSNAAVGLTEAPLRNGPLDTDRYGAAVTRHLRPPATAAPVPLLFDARTPALRREQGADGIGGHVERCSALDVGSIRSSGPFQQSRDDFCQSGRSSQM